MITRRQMFSLLPLTGIALAAKKLLPIDATPTRPFADGGVLTTDEVRRKLAFEDPPESSISVHIHIDARGGEVGLEDKIARALLEGSKRLQRQIVASKMP
jgi:hypothetical protein